MSVTVEEIRTEVRQLKQTIMENHDTTKKELESIEESKTMHLTSSQSEQNIQLELNKSTREDIELIQIKMNNQKSTIESACFDVEEAQIKIGYLAERVKFMEQNAQRQNQDTPSSSKCCIKWLWDGTLYLLDAAFRRDEILDNEDDLPENMSAQRCHGNCNNQQNMSIPLIIAILLRYLAFGGLFVGAAGIPDYAPTNPLLHFNTDHKLGKHRNKQFEHLQNLQKMNVTYYQAMRINI